MIDFLHIEHLFSHLMPKIDFFFLAIYILSPLAEFLLSNAIKNISSTFNVVGKIVAGMLCNYFTLMYWNSLLVWTYLIQNENLCIKNSTRRLKIFKIKKFSSLIHRTFFSVLFSLYYINRKLKEKSFWFFHASKKKFFFQVFFKCTKSLKSPSFG